MAQLQTLSVLQLNLLSSLPPPLIPPRISLLLLGMLRQPKTTKLPLMSLRQMTMLSTLGQLLILMGLMETPDEVSLCRGWDKKVANLVV
jgi:hypothetical protein